MDVGWGVGVGVDVGGIVEVGAGVEAGRGVGVGVGVGIILPSHADTSTGTIRKTRMAAIHLQTTSDRSRLLCNLSITGDSLNQMKWPTIAHHSALLRLYIGPALGDGTLEITCP